MGGIVKINSVFKPLYTSKKRYFLITGGRGSLKSSTVHDFIARLTYESGHGVLFTRYTMASAEKSIIPEFKVALERLGAVDDFYITKNKITNRQSGSFILFSGIKTSSGDQTANLKSISGITTWVIEEGEDFQDEKAFDQIDDSIRSTLRPNRVLWVQNPTTKEHFIYKRFIEPNNKQKTISDFQVTVSNHEDVEHIHTTYEIAEKLGYLSKGWLKKAKDSFKKTSDVKNKYKTHYYFNYIGGWLEQAEGVIFGDWSEGKTDSVLPYVYALDWGYSPDPLAMVRVAVDKKQKLIYVKEMIYETEIDDVAARFKAIGVTKKDLIICDTNEPRTRKSLKNLGYNITNALKEKIVEDIREIKNYKLIIDPDSPNLKTELNNYVWNDKKSQSIPIDAFNHSLDAMRYGFRRIVNGKRRIISMN